MEGLWQAILADARARGLGRPGGRDEGRPGMATGEGGRARGEDASERMLGLLDSGCRALSEARSLDELMLIRDQAKARRHSVRQRDLGKCAMNDAAEVKLRAERRLGELLAATPREQGKRTDRTSHEPRTKLQEMGGSRTDQHRWQQIASVPAEEFEAHIAGVRDAGEELSTAGVLELSKELEGRAARPAPAPAITGCTSADLARLVELGLRFGTIVADPPWDYDNRGTRANAKRHYTTVTVDWLATQPVKQLAADCCHLHLWTTNAFLFECPRLFKEWGFDYQGVFVWCKPQMGLGNCWRVSHEFLLLAIRGEDRCFPDTAHDMMSWAAIDRPAGHSSKPEQVTAMIERASPTPRFEMFGRRSRQGWLVWGDEIERDLFYKELEGV